MFLYIVYNNAEVEVECDSDILPAVIARHEDLCFPSFEISTRHLRYAITTVKHMH